jgi:hypothetical protein
MATIDTTKLPNLGEQGEPCSSCGMPLASDQRYCLNCGNRRGGPRLDFEKELLGGGTGEPPAGNGAAPSSAPERPPQRDVGPIAAVAGIAALGAMLLIGVLIGKGNTSSTTPAAAPVVQVGGAATTAGTGTGTDTGASIATASQTFKSDWPSGKTGYTVELGSLPKQGTSASQVEAQKSDAESKGASDVGALDSDLYASLPAGNFIVYSGVYGTKSEATKALSKLKGNFPKATVVKVSKSAGGGGGTLEPVQKGGLLTTKDKNATVQATNNDLKQLQSKTGQDYENAIKKLPDTIKTPGKPPPTDNKPPGGGSGGGITIK